MPSPSVKHLFPRLMDGVEVSLPTLSRATGLTKYDISRALAADPAIATVAALKAAIREYKSKPSPLVHRPGRGSLLWNGCDRHRNRLNKAGTK